MRRAWTFLPRLPCAPPPINVFFMVDANTPLSGIRTHDAAPVAGAGAARASEGLTFREILSGLNPLQHIPVIGTIYRAITGDAIPETSRRIGSFAVSGLMGGPIGMLTNLALLAIEKLTGIDPEKVGQDILASVGIGGHADAVPASTDIREASHQSQEPTDALQSELVSPSAWSSSQLLAYGVQTDEGGNLRRGDLRGSDVLNDLFLVRFAA